MVAILAGIKLESLRLVKGASFSGELRWRVRMGIFLVLEEGAEGGFGKVEE